MRLQRLEVPGFGCLRDLTVDFHPGVTVLLGDNESGKTTLHRAVRAALYGLDAGRQGRPVDRSDWWRWKPWVAGPYGVALTYVLGDGRVVRVARSFESREHTVQVLELGGSDLTDELRRGRQVVPGLYHLGIDDEVFCATAWLGDDGLRSGSPEAAAQRAEALQDAIERLADSRRGVTAAAAMSRLREALHEVGSERRAGSPLGAATARVRELDRRLLEVSRRHQLLGLERERLRQFETAAAAAADQREAAEAGWLRARLRSVEARIAAIDEASAERQAAERTVALTAHRAHFPLELETRASALAGELRQATLTAAEAAARAEAAAQPLGAARSRLAEVEAGLAIVKRSPEVEETLAERLSGAEEDLRRVERAVAQLHGANAGDARILALRREIASTGLAAMPLGSADALAALVRASRGRGPVAVLVAGCAAALAGAAACTWLGWSRHVLPALGLASLFIVIAAVLAVRAAARRRRALAAGAEIADLEERLGIAAGDLDQVRDRVPALQALHAALLREEAARAGRHAEFEAVAAAAAALLRRCEALAAPARISVATAPGATLDAILDRSRLLLQRVREAVALQQRRRDLGVEQRQLRNEIAAYEALVEERERCSDTAARIASALNAVLGEAGLAAAPSAQVAISAVREACEERRSHDQARHTLAVAGQRIAALGDREALAQAAAQLRDELRQRGLEGVLGDRAPDDTRLHLLEHEARRAAQAQHAAAASARELRAKLEGMLEGLPALADLQDEREAQEQIRRRCLQQQAALTTALRLVEQAARTTHRDLAPSLATFIAGHLGTLTDERYRAVNVDTDHFGVSLLCRDRAEMVPLEHVSHGTRDQVSLLLRLALCSALSGADETAPLLLDEPLLTADPARRAGMLRFLHELSETHQLVLTTADPEVAACVRDECGAGCETVQLQATSRAAQGAEPAIRVAG